MRRFIVLLVILVFSVSLAFSQSGGTRYVAVENIEVKDSAGFFGGSLGTLPFGTAVTVIREDGKWTQVNAGHLSGWVASSGLNTRRVVAAGSAVTPQEIALAGKGFSPEVEAEYKKGGGQINYAAVDEMEKVTIVERDLLTFIEEGHLSRGE